MPHSVAFGTAQGNQQLHEKKVGAGSGPDPSSPANQSIDAGRLDNMSDTTIPGRRPSVGSWHRSRWDLLTVVPLAVLVLAVVAVLHPPQSGPLALAFMLEEHIFIAALAILTPIALLARARVLGVALIVVMVTGGASFGSEWISLPGSGATRHDLSVMTWNLDHGLRTPAETAAELQGMTVDVIALQELEPDASAAIEANLTIAAGYPYRAMAPRLGADGLAILSRYPIESIESPDNPPYLELIVDTPRGPVRVIDAHPTHGEIDKASRLRLPVDFDPTDRSAAIASVRVPIDAALSRGERLLVLGDFNTAPTDPENRVLTKGLRDTHVEVGEGPGWTWRPGRLTVLPFGLLRIDRQLTAGAIVPASTSVDCSLPGDHCRLFGTYEIDR